jgi:hypothetical protein
LDSVLMANVFMATDAGGSKLNWRAQTAALASKGAFGAAFPAAIVECSTGSGRTHRIVVPLPRPYRRADKVCPWERSISCWVVLGAWLRRTPLSTATALRITRHSRKTGWARVTGAEMTNTSRIPISEIGISGVLSGGFRNRKTDPC